MCLVSSSYVCFCVSITTYKGCQTCTNWSLVSLIVTVLFHGIKGKFLMDNFVYMIIITPSFFTLQDIIIYLHAIYMQLPLMCILHLVERKVLNHDTQCCDCSAMHLSEVLFLYPNLLINWPPTMQSAYRCFLSRCMLVKA
jgi:hypothetical protein